ncbi:MAG: RHS repeat-associated core domain-containing protein, partial [Bacteroidota bacterium]|nr:RHS repeat-associated core domain-containing protein [Bacteroidota bacterium]
PTGALYYEAKDLDKPKYIITYFGYNSKGNNIGISIAPAGLTSRLYSMAYDGKGRFLEEKTNPLGHKSFYAYESIFGNVVNETAINGLQSSYHYDGFGRLTQTITPQGHIITTEQEFYSSSSLPYSLFRTITQAPGAPESTIYYDGLGREIRSTTDGPDGLISVDTKYNDKGQLWKISNPYYYQQTPTNWTEYFYTARGRIDKEQYGLLETNYEYGQSTTITNSAGQTTEKTFNGLGNLESVIDNNNQEIEYDYYSDGQIHSISTMGSVVSMVYDDYGYQTHLTDPNAGTTEYLYNAYGELEWQKDGRGNEYTMIYDRLGRITSKTDPEEGVYTYTYCTEGEGIGQLASVSGPNYISKEFSYDIYGRVVEVTESIKAQDFITSYEYDQYGNNTRTAYPSGFSITREYDQNGYLSEVKRGDNGNSIWKAEYINPLGQAEQYWKGNMVFSNISYDDTYGFLEEIHTDGLNDTEYNFDIYSGNLNYRKELVRILTETFTYDNLNRLRTTSINGQPGITIDYEGNGNISFKTDAGNYEYHDIKKHAVEEISNNPGTISELPQNILYTPFNKIKYISENGNDQEMHFDYGPNYNRKKVQYRENASLISTKYYLGNYEKKISGSNTQEIHYIAGGDGLAAMYIIEDGTGTMYYVFKDHLGSPTAILNESTMFVDYYSYDAWGRRRNPDNWSYDNIPAAFFDFNRGFTGHEHIDEFGLINMNGRVYDPVLGRFLSPDNYVQLPDFTQNFNRYSYAWNNPLVYTDPSGEFIWIIPNVGWSMNGGLSVGVSVVVGIPGVASAQTGVGYNFRSGDPYAYAGVSAMFNTVYTSYSPSGGWNAGYTAGASPFSGLPISSNFGTVGVNYNLTHDSWSGNVSAWSVDQSGWTFNPSFSAMIYPEHTTNLFRRQGFRSNDGVLRQFAANNDHNGAIEYFGFEGKYRPEKAAGGDYVEGNDYFGSVNPSTGEISYGKLAFSSYDHLYSTFVKEASTSLKIKSGEQILTQEGYDFRNVGGKNLTNYPEETAGFIAMYKKNGFYPSIRQKSILSNINYYQNQIYAPSMHPNFIHHRWHIIYRIPRLW